MLRNYHGELQGTDVLAGLVGHVLAVVAGCAIGAILMRPVGERAGTTFLNATVATLAEILLPNAPPIRQLLDLFEAQAPRHVLVTMIALTLETLLAAAAVVLVVHRYARRHD